MIRLSILPCLATALYAADAHIFPTTDTTCDVRVVAGIAPGISDGTISEVQVPGHPSFDQNIDGAGGIGLGLGVRVGLGFWRDTDFGWRVGLEGMSNRSTGSLHAIDSSGNQSSTTTDLGIQTVTATVLAGPVFRVIQDSLDYPGDFCEIELLLGAGYGQAQAINNSASSSTGMALRLQAEAGIIFTSFSRIQYGLSLGYTYMRADGMSWDNTGDTTITLSGVSANASLGYRF